MTLMLSITALFIVSTGIQFWCTDFFINVLELPQKQAFQNYAICGAVAPIVGVLLSGFIFDRIGGYNSRNALPAINVFGFLALISALLTTYLQEANSVTIFLALEGMCGGILMPAATGIMLNQVPAGMRTASNSIANLSYNLFGYVPAPYLYGHFQQVYGGRAGLSVIQGFCLLAYLLLVIFTIRKYLEFFNEAEPEEAAENNPQGAPSVNSDKKH